MLGITLASGADKKHDLDVICSGYGHSFPSPIVSQLIELESDGGLRDFVCAWGR